MSAKKGFKIGEVCKLLDIQPYVLRYWETEFVALHPAKSQSGQRVYVEAEVAVIRRIKELLYDEGYTIAGAKKKLESREIELAGDVKGARRSRVSSIRSRSNPPRRGHGGRRPPRQRKHRPQRRRSLTPALPTG